jgi:hypothetical protein
MEFINKDEVDVIGIQETMKLDFFAKDLDQLGVRKDFVLDWLSAEEHFGGGGPFWFPI